MIGAFASPPEQSGGVLQLRHLSPSIGTEVSGVQLGALSEDAFHQIYALLLERKVIFFRDQDLGIEQHVALGRRFGDLEELPFLESAPGQPEVLVIRHNGNDKGRENVWHSDVSWREAPAKASILKAIEVPEVGGDTIWADMCAAYDDLPDKTKRTAGVLHAVHTQGGLSNRTASGKTFQRVEPVTHPVIRTHPETGRKLIYVNRTYTRFDDAGDPEREALLRLLAEKATLPEYQCRFRWERNSVAIWDNRSTQHYAVSDYYPAERVMHRVTIKGDRPY